MAPQEKDGARRTADEDKGRLEKGAEMCAVQDLAVPRRKEGRVVRREVRTIGNLKDRETETGGGGQRAR